MHPYGSIGTGLILLNFSVSVDVILISVYDRHMELLCKSV